MARGTLFTTLVTWLRAELRDAQETNTATSTEYTYLLQNNEKSLANAFHWPFLEDKWELALSPGDRYKNIPTSNIRGIASTINFERPVEVTVKFNTYYQPVTYGIGVDEMNIADSSIPVTLDPVSRWSMDTNTADSSNPNQIEIWPVPATAQTLRFTGQRMVNSSTIADLDDLLLVYSTAAEYLADRDNTKAPLVAAKAQKHLLKLRAGYPAKVIPPTVLGGNQFMYQPPVKLIAIR